MKIITIKNFNRFTGRYSRKGGKSVEKKLNWYIDMTFMERFPVLSFRSKIWDDKKDIYSWDKSRDTKIAISLALNILKAWQAYRPYRAKILIGSLERKLLRKLTAFQSTMTYYGVYDSWDICKSKNRKEIRDYLCEIVYEISEEKDNRKPMLGSKVMNFFYPELFPVWDTIWIGNEALRNIRHKNQYETYLDIFYEELANVTNQEWKKLERAFIAWSEIPGEVLKWHFSDISAIVFEKCLLGKNVKL